MANFSYKKTCSVYAALSQSCIDEYYGLCNGVTSAFWRNSMSTDSDSRMAASRSPAFNRQHSCPKNYVILLCDKSGPIYHQARWGLLIHTRGDLEFQKVGEAYKPLARMSHSPDPAVPPLPSYPLVSMAYLIFLACIWAT